MKNSGVSLNNFKKHAFSLVEMLMALLVASLLLAALAPVITKRAGSESLNIAGGGNVINPPAGSYCWSASAGGGSSAIEQDSDGNRVVKYTTEQGIYFINLMLASGGGGGGGASKPKTEPKELISTNAAELKIESNMDEFDIVSIIGAGGGGGGGAAVDDSTTCKGAPSIEKCECMGAKYDSESKVCVSGNQGSKNRTDAITACSAAAPAGKWQLPTTTQLSNWNQNTFYSTLGISSGNTVWTQNTTQGDCVSQGTRYRCYCEGSYRDGRTSSSECCSGCSWGIRTSGYYKFCSSIPPNYWSSTNSGSSNCESGKSYYCVCTAGQGNSAYPAAQSWCQRGYYGSCRTSCSSCNNWCSNTCATSSTTTTECSVTASSYQGCTSYNTNYYFYQLSGSSWTQSYETAGTGSRSTYCVYSDSNDVTGEAFYSLSGGGGGGAPAIEDNNFDSNVLKTFRQRIKENVGGYIVLEKGKGGKGGDASTSKNQSPDNAKNGESTCIAITGPDKSDVKYRLCVSGGKFGHSADASKSDSSSTGWGKGGDETPLENACFAIDYTSNPIGDTITFDCSKKGNPGGPGGASTSNPTPGGKGGSSVLNSTQAGGTAVVNGVSASSTNYGAGGGGGSASKTGSGASGTLSFGKGGAGADGYIKLNYKIKYDAAGGGGGGSGNLAVIKEYRVNQAECTFIIGKGGSGGNIESNGGKGGDTSVSCTGGGGETFVVYGGEGGKTGTTAETLTGTSTGGKGGLHNIGGAENNEAYSTDITSLAPSKRTLKTGLDGTQGGVNDSNYTNYIQNTYSAGGRGGMSGAGKKGGCGALQNDSVCTYNTAIIPDITSVLGESFPVSSVKFPDLKTAESFGESSSGGGGGGWHTQAASGKGGDGLGGFACIWWEKVE